MVVSTWILVAIVAIHHQATEIQAASLIHKNPSKISTSKDSDVDVATILKYLVGLQSSREDASIQHEEPAIPICQRGDGTAEKVQNGVPATEEWGKWFVEIHNNDSGLICGGTRISPKLILTSAHCFFKPQPQNENKSRNCLDNIPGQPVARLKSPNRTPENVSIIRVYKHPQFSGLQGSEWAYWSDVAIAILSTTFESSPFVPRFCLMEGDHTKEDNCTAFGVGYTKKVGLAGNTDRARPKQLQKVVVEVPIDGCTNIVDLHPHMKDIVCITDGGAKGDSGSPVMCKRPGDDMPYMLGIISQVKQNETATILHKTTGRGRLWIQKFLISKEAKSDRCHENKPRSALDG